MYKESNHKNHCSFCLEYDYAENLYNTDRGYLCEYCRDDFECIGALGNNLYKSL